MTQAHPFPLTAPTWPSRGLAVAIGGPTLIGALIGLGTGGGLAGAVQHGFTLTAIIVGVAALTLPALYVGAAMNGLAPPLRDAARASQAAMVDAGIVMLGLAPVLAFFALTASSGATVLVLVHLLLAIGLLIPMQALYVRVFADADRQHVALSLFAAWALVALAMGWKFFFDTMTAGVL